MTAPLRHTWDGLPVAQDPPHGSMVVVGRGGRYLMLHRAAQGPGHEGDWAWTPPSGARLPGEPVLAGARRELAEEAGITRARLIPVDLSGPWAVFVTTVGDDQEITIDAEHDRFTWVSLDEALARCLPAAPNTSLRGAGAVTERRIEFRRVPGGAHAVVADGVADGELRYRHDPGEIVLDGVADDRDPQLIWSYLEDVVFPACPGVPRVAAAPRDGQRTGSQAASLEKAGFTMRQDGGYVLDRARVFGD